MRSEVKLELVRTVSDCTTLYLSSNAHLEPKVINFYTDIPKLGKSNCISKSCYLAKYIFRSFMCRDWNLNQKASFQTST